MKDLKSITSIIKNVFSDRKVELIRKNGSTNIRVYNNAKTRWASVTEEKECTETVRCITGGGLQDFGDIYETTAYILSPITVGFTTDRYNRVGDLLESLISSLRKLDRA